MLLTYLSSPFSRSLSLRFKKPTLSLEACATHYPVHIFPMSSSKSAFLSLSLKIFPSQLFSIGI